MFYGSIKVTDCSVSVRISQSLVTNTDQKIVG